jgi:hypothetical protein
LVPTLLTSAVLSRWWNVTPSELLGVALFQELGEDLITAGAQDTALRERVLEALWDQLLPSRLEHVERFLETGASSQAAAQLTPAELLRLGAWFFQEEPAKAENLGEAGRELARLAQSNPDEIRWERISEDFGVPHPVLAQTYARELLATKPLPTFLGYSSRLLAESWESTALYCARLAVEKNLPPAALHSLVPTLTHRTIEKIAASHLEDWPAVLLAMREAGEEFRTGKIPSLARLGSVSGPRGN